MTVRSIASGVHGLTVWTKSGAASTVPSGGGGVVSEPEITFTSIAPTSSTTGAGSVGTLTGSGYVGPVSVAFGAYSSNTKAVVDNSTITCTIPTAAAAGALTVTVTQGSKQASSSNFTYFGVPTYTSITPTSSATAGAIILTIIGEQYLPSTTTVTLGANNATGVQVTAFSSLTCAVPSSTTTGAVSVVIATPSGSVTALDAFTYIATDEPVAPATAVAIANYVPGSTLVDGTKYLLEDFDRYTDNGNDVTLLVAGNTHYGSNNVRTVYYNTNFFSLVAGQGGSGLAIRTAYSAAGNEPILRTPDALGAYSGTIVFQFSVRFPDAGEFPNSSGMKFYEMYYAGHHGRIQLGIKNNAFHFNNGWAPLDDSAAGQEIGYQPVGPYPTALNDGNWHRVTILYRPNTTSASGANVPAQTFAVNSSRDGRAAAWIDATKIVDISAATVGVTPAGGTKVWCTNWDLDCLGGTSVFNIGYNQYPEYINGLTGAFHLDTDNMKIWVIP